MVQYFIISVIFAVCFIFFAYYTFRYDEFSYRNKYRKDDEPVKYKKITKGNWWWIGCWTGFIFLFSLWFNLYVQPVFNMHVADLYLEILVFVIFSLVLQGIKSDDISDNPVEFKGIFAVIGFGFLLLCSQFYSCDGWHAEGKQQMLAPNTVVLEQDSLDSDTLLIRDSIVVATSNKDICVVSYAMAEKSGLTKLGDLKNTYKVYSYTKQSVTCDIMAKTTDGNQHIIYKDHLCYVGLLEHKGFLTWWKNPYSPGYVLVDACNPSKYWVILGIDGKDLQIKYTPNAWFSKNLERHMRCNGYAGSILADFDMEINEKGYPFAPVTVEENTIAFGTPIVTGVAVVDLISGEIKQYQPKDAPAFVNMIQPKDVMYDRITWWGDYIYGWIHWSEKTGLTEPCKGMDVVQTEKGSFFYVGISAQGDSVATQGYMLINTRTGETTYYQRRGISEDYAARVMGSPEDLSYKIKHGVLELSEPIYYNIDGIPTYFATYVSPADQQAKLYGFCSAENRSVWAYGVTLEEARQKYDDACSAALGKNVVDFSDAQNLTFVEVKVLEKTNIDKVFYFRFDGYKDKVFTAELRPELSDMLWESKGRKVKVSFNKTDNSKFVTLSSYEIMK